MLAQPSHGSIAVGWSQSLSIHDGTVVGSLLEPFPLSHQTGTQPTQTELESHFPDSSSEPRCVLARHQSPRAASSISKALTPSSLLPSGAAHDLTWPNGPKKYYRGCFLAGWQAEGGREPLSSWDGKSCWLKQREHFSSGSLKHAVFLKWMLRGG